MSTDSITPSPAPLPQSAAPAPDAERHEGKSFIVTWLFALLLGALAVDRFYLGKIGTGILKLITFGGAGIWVLVDIILVLTGAQRDKAGRPLAGYAQHKKTAWFVTAAFLALSLLIGGVNAAAGSDEAASQDSAIEASEVVADEPASIDKAEPETPAEPVAPAEPEEPTAQSWADETFGAFVAETHTGTGDSLITLPAGATAALVSASHDGSRNFVISVLDATNASTGDLLANTIGTYSGTTVYGFNSFGEGRTLQVTADGNWSIVVAPLSAAPILAPTGSGDAVFLYDGSAAALAVSHTGERNFIVSEETGKAYSMGLLVNQIGNYSGTVPLSAGPSIISVNADGGWTLTVS